MGELFDLHSLVSQCQLSTAVGTMIPVLPRPRLIGLQQDVPPTPLPQTLSLVLELKVLPLDIHRVLLLVETLATAEQDVLSPLSQNLNQRHQVLCQVHSQVPSQVPYHLTYHLTCHLTYHLTCHLTCHLTYHLMCRLPSRLRSQVPSQVP